MKIEAFENENLEHLQRDINAWLSDRNRYQLITVIYQSYQPIPITHNSTMSGSTTTEINYTYVIAYTDNTPGRGFITARKVGR